LARQPCHRRGHGHAASPGRRLTVPPAPPAPTTPTTPTTPGALLLARRGDLRAGLIAGERTWSWDAVVRESLLRGAVLRRLGRADPGHVGLLLENTPEHVFWIGGAALAGGTLVGGTLPRRGDALGGDLRHTECRALIVGPDQRELLAGVDTGVP